MDVDANDLIASLKLQREVQATEAAMMDAACKGLLRTLAERDRTIAEQAARIAELEATPREASP